MRFFNMKSAFITGATGLVGSSLLNSLITETELRKFYILVRDKEKTKEDLKEVLNKSSKLGKDILLIGGDITKENLGLSQDNIDKLKESEEVYHLAAIISLSKDNRDKIFKTNLEGTRNLLNFFKDSKKIKNIFYFSTAYVCGRQNQVVKEDWIEKPNIFRNHYEESKWLAESLIKEYVDNYKIPVTIFRPTIVGSEDKFKFNQLSNQTIYLHGRIIRKATLDQKEDKEIRLVGKTNTFINLIAIEEILKILLKIRLTKEKNRIYNLANPNNCLAMSFLKGLQEVIGFKSGYRFVENLNIEDLSETEKSIYEKTKHYFEYNLSTNLKWDTANTGKIRKELNLTPKDETWLKNHAKDFFSYIKNEQQ